ncbi:MAG: hypothetical protein H0V66_14900 [Bdellovibrionales bacterium]|nr:hypothetical protein [Bdellovibrionales bacterium]
MNFDDQRKYIHDLANTLSIVEASVVRVLTLLTKNNPQLEDEINRLKKADEYSKKSIEALRSLREVVHQQIKKSES